MGVTMHSFYMDVAKRVSLLSEAKRKKVGCIIEKDGNIIAFGWNGTPHNFYTNDCENNIDGQIVSKPEVVHAEMNAFAKLLQEGVSCKGATLYITLSPCFDCSKLIIQSKIQRVIYDEEYRDTAPLELLTKCGVDTRKLLLDNSLILYKPN
jgi:dCMP deaminase